MYVCKGCGSDDLVSVERIEGNCGITGIYMGVGGALIPQFDGYTSIDWDSQRTEGFMCASCFHVADQLESLVVKAGTFCFDPRHATPCPLPCSTCDEECD